MTRLLIALAALLIFGAQLTAPVEAQGSWTCNWDFTGSNPPPSGWAITNGQATASGYRATIGSTEYYAQLVYSAGGTTFTSISAEFLATTSVAGPRYIASMPSPASGTVWNGTGSNSLSWSGSAGTAEIFIGDYSSSPSNNIWITSMALAGTGTSPCPATPTPTSVPPTATGTPAPPTATPEVWVVNTFLTPTPIAIDASGLYEALQRGNDNLLGLPPDLNTSSLPQEDGRQVFAYVKWLISPSSADEIAGPFAPIISHTGIFLSLTFFLAVVYAVVWVSVFLFKFVVWIFKLILLIVDLVLQVAQAVGQFIGGIVKFLLGG